MVLKTERRMDSDTARKWETRWEYYGREQFEIYRHIEGGHAIQSGSTPRGTDWQT